MIQFWSFLAGIIAALMAELATLFLWSLWHSSPRRWRP